MDRVSVFFVCFSRVLVLCSGVVGNMSSGLLEPPGGGEQLCVFLVRGEGGDEERGRSREVGCQWESPEEEQRKEVGCQSDSAERRDAAVQVDLLTQQLSWTHTGETHLQFT